MYFWKQKECEAKEVEERAGYFNRATPVFGMLKREGKVYTQVVKNRSASALMPKFASILVSKIQQFLVILGKPMMV